ncbi:MAG: hypothetical protein QOF46_357, partial [Paraburkholderia sp.]|nr:hypothetical protein [Paraburkholderia sp.]
LLDGVAAGIFGVVAVVIASDLMRGTGRFNLAQGLMALAVGVGAALSNVTGGFVVQRFGFPACFLVLSIVAANVVEISIDVFNELPEGMGQAYSSEFFQCPTWTLIKSA